MVTLGEALLGVMVVVCAFAAPASAGGPFMMVGAAEDVVKTQDYAFAKSEMDNLKLAGLDTIRVTQTWTRGQTSSARTTRSRLATP